MSKGLKRRPGKIPDGSWEVIFTKLPNQCKCEPGDCKAISKRWCADLAKRGGKL